MFAQSCARCHSSIAEAQGGPFAARDFRKVDAQGMREDFLGNDQATQVTEVGTYRCRALHSNHMQGHVWQEYASETLRARGADPNVKEPSDGGRGYYRNISLLSTWAHAPFMHNNAIGPELCGAPQNKANDFYRSPYVDADGRTLPAGKAPACWPYDPSVDGRFKLYVASMEELLNPSQRTPKLTRFNADVTIPLGPRLLGRQGGASGGGLHAGRSRPAPPPAAWRASSTSASPTISCSPSSSPTPSTRGWRSSSVPRRASSSPRTCAA